MVDRASALDGHYKSGRYGAEGEPGVTLTVVRELNLQQLAAWPETVKRVGQLAAAALELDHVPAPGRAAELDHAAMLRIEPLKWWLVNAAAHHLPGDEGATLDISHSRTCIRIHGDNATDLLNRFLPLDLRSASFPRGSVASSSLHHVGVTLWRSRAGFELFIPRGFALSVWEVLFESARQFGVEVV